MPKEKRKRPARLGTIAERLAVIRETPPIRKRIKENIGRGRREGVFEKNPPRIIEYIPASEENFIAGEKGNVIWICQKVLACAGKEIWRVGG